MSETTYAFSQIGGWFLQIGERWDVGWIVDQQRPRLCSLSVPQEAARTRKEWLNCLFRGKDYIGSKFSILFMSKQNQMCQRFIGEMLGVVKWRGNRSRQTTMQDWTCGRREGWKELGKKTGYIAVLGLQCSSEKVSSRGSPKQTVH